MKKILTAILALSLILTALFGLTSCGNDAKYHVGVCQLAQHFALDDATRGFCDALTQAFGDDVAIDVKNASGETTNCTPILNNFVAANVDLILANATPALTAAAAATKDIPILGTSVTDYASALEIDNWTGTCGGNISGTSDLAPLAEQAAMIKELFPDAKTVAVLFCSAESNSRYQVDVMTAELAKLGITVVEKAFTDSNDITSVTQSALSCDVIYVPTDNTAASNTEAIANVVLPAKKPVVAGEMGICKGCGVASLSIDYYDLGIATGQMAAKILRGEADVSEMPIEFAPKPIKLYNKAVCEQLGITPPEGYSEITD